MLPHRLHAVQTITEVLDLLSLVLNVLQMKLEFFFDVQFVSRWCPVYLSTLKIENSLSLSLDKHDVSGIQDGIDNSGFVGELVNGPDASRPIVVFPRTEVIAHHDATG